MQGFDPQPYGALGPVLSLKIVAVPKSFPKSFPYPFPCRIWVSIDIDVDASPQGGQPTLQCSRRDGQGRMLLDCVEAHAAAGVRVPVIKMYQLRTKKMRLKVFEICRCGFCLNSCRFLQRKLQKQTPCCSAALRIGPPKAPYVTWPLELVLLVCFLIVLLVVILKRPK